MPLTIDTDLRIAGGTFMRLPSKQAANPFSGSLLSFDTGGFARRLVAGEPFAGVCRQSIATADAATSDGSRSIEVIQGHFLITATVTGATQADAVRRRNVYASDDGALTLTAAGNTMIGTIVGLDAGKALILCRTAEIRTAGPVGHEVIADANATLTVAQLDKLLICTPTAGRTLALPPAAQCTGRVYHLVTLAAFALTVDPDLAELVNGAATFAGGATAGSILRIYSTGTAWVSC